MGPGAQIVNCSGICEQNKQNAGLTRGQTGILDTQQQPYPLFPFISLALFVPVEKCPEISKILFYRHSALREFHAFCVFLTHRFSCGAFLPCWHLGSDLQPHAGEVLPLNQRPY